MFIITLLLYKLLKLAACSDHFIWILPRQAGAKNTDVILIQTIFSPWIMSPPMQCVDMCWHNHGRPTVFLICLVWVIWCCNNRVNYQVWQLLMGGHTYGWEHNTVLPLPDLYCTLLFQLVLWAITAKHWPKFVQSNQSGTFDLKP